MTLMLQGGLLFEKSTMQIMKIIGIVTPLFLLIYGILIATEQVESLNYLGDAYFVWLMSAWLLLAAFQYLFPPRSKRSMFIVLVLYHFLAALYILFISGLDVPFLSAWALLYLASYIYFSYLGVVASAACFVIVMLIETIIYTHVANDFMFNAIGSIATLLVGAAAVSLNRIKELERESLAESQRNEELQRDRIMTLINNLADAVVSTDEKGVIQIYNASALNLFDTNKGLNGMSIDDALSLRLEGARVHLLPLLKKAKIVTINDSFTSQTGDETIRLEVTYAPIRASFERADKSGSHQGYVIIFRDVTKAKSLEEERDEFISVVSHELRTPITVTEGAIDNARVIFSKDISKADEAEASLKLAYEQVIFLSRMINDLSTLSRAERGVADEPESIDLRQLAHSLHTEYSDEAAKKHLKFNLSAPGKLGSVKVSRLYLHELLQNLITNAIKYTNEGQVDLLLERRGDEVTFTVKDTGIGIAKNEQTKVFNEFYRAEDYRTRETSGTGLGLYVATKLSIKLGTKITLKSRLNHGSSFSFTLPVEPTALGK